MVTKGAASLKIIIVEKIIIIDGNLTENWRERSEMIEVRRKFGINYHNWRHPIFSEVQKKIYNSIMGLMFIF